jgi:starch-binding outer membrane protein, SusD/RagB family
MRITDKDPRGGRSQWRLPRVALLAAGFVISATACDIDRVLQVDDPTVAAPGTVATEEAVPTTLSAALAAFQLAFSGAPGGGSYIESQITLSGILSDEFLISESFPTRVDVDQRETRFDNGTQLATYARMHTARRLAEYSAGLHAEFASRTNTPGHAHALNLAGFSYVLIGENYCTGVPFSTFDEAGAVVYGPPLTTNQMFEQAIVYFDQAIAAATAAGSAAAAVEQLNLARVGKARAQLNLNQPAAAAATAGPVPTTFVYRIFHSLGTGRQNNGIWGANQNRRGVTVADMEGGTGLPYRTDADPRVIHLRGGAAGSGVAQAVGFDNTTPLWVQLKYPLQTSSVVLASGVEARLIEAENQLRTGGDWLGTLNALRAAPPAAVYPATQYPDIGTLAPLAAPATEAARVDMLFKERAYWMWLTSHRVGDLRRLMRQYGRTQATAGWPTGPYFRGGDYGNHVSMLVPFDELNNPLFSSQFAPNGCDPSIP